jgi:hypothetical protein
MELKRKVYSVDEAAKLLSVDFMEVHRLVDEGALSKVPAISASSIQHFAVRKGIALKQESES